MVDRPCIGRLDLFPSAKVNNMSKKYPINNNDIERLFRFYLEIK